MYIGLGERKRGENVWKMSVGPNTWKCIGNSYAVVHVLSHLNKINKQVLIDLRMGYLARYVYTTTCDVGQFST